MQKIGKDIMKWRNKMTSCLDDTFYPETPNKCELCNQYLEEWEANVSICENCCEKIEKSTTTGERT